MTDDTAVGRALLDAIGFDKLPQPDSQPPTSEPLRRAAKALLDYVEPYYEGQFRYQPQVGWGTPPVEALRVALAASQEAADRTPPLDVDAVRSLNDAARTLVEQLDRHGIGNLALFEQQVAHLRGHLFSATPEQPNPDPYTTGRGPFHRHSGGEVCTDPRCVQS